jgi:hypothetical protein
MMKRITHNRSKYNADLKRRGSLTYCQIKFDLLHLSRATNVVRTHRDLLPILQTRFDRFQFVLNQTHRICTQLPNANRK